MLVLVCTILCWQITPAIGYLYAGMHRRKAALTMIFQSLFCACACGIQFWIYGYSLYQSRATNPMLGNLSLAGLHNVLAAPSLANSDIPDILYAAYGFTFVTATAMILAGAMLERGRLWPSMLFLLCWTTFVYYVLAYFEWNPNGWLYQLGVYDFAGSGPVHIATGFSALAWSLMLGPRISDHSAGERAKIVQHFKPIIRFSLASGLASSGLDGLLSTEPAQRTCRFARSMLSSTPTLQRAGAGSAGHSSSTCTRRNSASLASVRASSRALWASHLLPASSPFTWPR